MVVMVGLPLRKGQGAEMNGAVPAASSPFSQPGRVSLRRFGLLAAPKLGQAGSWLAAHVSQPRRWG